MRHDIRATVAALILDLDTLAARAQAAFDDASAEAYCNGETETDDLDFLFDAAERAASAADAARRAI